MRDPGAREVFTHGFDCSPCSTAFFANRPAPSMTDGLDVLVHEVIAAITTSPWSNSAGESPTMIWAGSEGQDVGGAIANVRGGSSRSVRALTAIGSLAGKDREEA